jgi:hypothetical protein
MPTTWMKVKTNTHQTCANVNTAKWTIPYEKHDNYVQQFSYMLVLYWRFLKSFFYYDRYHSPNIWIADLVLTMAVCMQHCKQKPGASSFANNKTLGAFYVNISTWNNTGWFLVKLVLQNLTVNHMNVLDFQNIWFWWYLVYLFIYSLMT